MAAPGTPDPGAGGPPGAGAQPSPPPPDAGGGAPPQGQGPTGAPASQEQIMLAKLYQACKGLAQQNPAMAPGLSKAAEGIQEAQSALVTQPQQGQPPPQQTPPY